MAGLSESDQAGERDVELGNATGDERGTATELFAPDERGELERRWYEIQTRFVDEPRGSVEEANALVDDLMQRLVSRFSDERAELEAQWDRGDEVTTEDLRTTLQRYRSFFARLLDLGVER